jgi:SAM-dependent methyltransferase
MPESNYKSQWWGYIYDQMMENNSDWVDTTWRFYQENLKGVHGPVLECACGTGLFLLPLLQSGFDMYGFDISPSMLATLRKKAAAQGIEDIADRISVQDLELFHYEQRFDAILIPTNTFGMLVTQEAQIRALCNIFDHLAPGGKLLLDLRLAGVRDLADLPEIDEGNWYTWIHPETGLQIRQRLVGRSDFNQQLILDRCFIEYEGQIEEFPMTGRWIFKEEFQLLLRLAGFKHWKCLSTVDGDLLIVGREEAFSYWIVEK